MAGVVVVFDFDFTLIDCDSENWVVDAFGLTDLFEQFLPTMSWNSLMDKIMKELHSKGRSIEDIEGCLKTIPLDSHIASAIKIAHTLGCELRIVSDANKLFIETILVRHGLLEYFSEINTNPCYVDEEGRLRILPYHDHNIVSVHGCNLCPPNMCKGMIVDRIQASSGIIAGKKQVIYVGDGKGDYCPSLRLTEGDYLMPRKDYPLSKLLNANSDLLKAKPHHWSSSEELKEVLLRLITQLEEEANSLSLMSCNHKEIQESPQELSTFM
ncbi:thiamine phosphate phosphatase-like protein [Curcuma longa]|uniref:thiamine phosphate phosphatase-like protein n=1 Tax=Curcuma longa TaxID=136217 RepID=UPI003D9EFC23